MQIVYKDQFSVTTMVKYGELQYLEKDRVLNIYTPSATIHICVFPIEPDIAKQLTSEIQRAIYEKRWLFDINAELERIKPTPQKEYDKDKVDNITLNQSLIRVGVYNAELVVQLSEDDENNYSEQLDIASQLCPAALHEALNFKCNINN